MSENLNPIVLEVEEVRVINAVSPTVDVQRIENGAEVIIHDYRGTQTVEIYDGVVGPVGPKGDKGDKGDKGNKGDKGDAYVLTQADREEIAGIAEENFSTEVKQWHDTVVEKAGQVSTDKGIVEGYMNRSETAADRAEQAMIKSGYLFFYIENGKLYMDRTKNTKVDFYLEDGKLYVREVA